MALFKEVKCGRCDRRYSSIRSRCPYCGARKTNTDRKAEGGSASKGSSQKWQLIVGAVILVIIIIAIILLVAHALKNKDIKDDNPKTTSSLVNPDDGITSLTPDPTPTPTPTVTSITLNRTDFTLNAIGAQWQMTATTSPAASGAEITWYSEDESVAIISETGMVTAINRGTTNVVAMAGGKQAKCIVRVTADAIVPITPTEP
ncbi:MAG: Ig-like domain-containing protein, partial [Oscillospiraceae bacterium]|nr:Ig-like domain-containing protein [Oscillospiraceae bacterium]